LSATTKGDSLGPVQENHLCICSIRPSRHSSCGNVLRNGSLQPVVGVDDCPTRHTLGREREIFNRLEREYILSMWLYFLDLSVALSAIHNSCCGIL
jgi:hypothetical protein